MDDDPKNWFKDNKVKVLERPWNAPDLNPVEKLLQTLNRRLRKKEAYKPDPVPPVPSRWWGWHEAFESDRCFSVPSIPITPTSTPKTPADYIPNTCKTDMPKVEMIDHLLHKLASCYLLINISKILCIPSLINSQHKWRMSCWENNLDYLEYQCVCVCGVCGGVEGPSFKTASIKSHRRPDSH